MEEDEKTEKLELKGEVNNQLAEVLKRHGCGGLLDEFEKFPQIQQMHIAREQMTGDPSILEIKHVADEVESIKTRGQIGYLPSGQVTILAKCGHRPPSSTDQQDTMTSEGNWLREHVERARQGRDLIDSYEQETLPSIKTILESEGTLDLTTQVRSRKVNIDYDYKRKIVRDPENKNQISPFTVPHRNRSEMLQYRNEMESIRRNRSKKKVNKEEVTRYLGI